MRTNLGQIDQFFLKSKKSKKKSHQIQKKTLREKQTMITQIITEIIQMMKTQKILTKGEITTKLLKIMNKIIIKMTEIMTTTTTMITIIRGEI